MEREYIPISCSLHDELLSLATLRRRARIVFRDAGREEMVESRIEDVFSRSGAEYLRTDGGALIRLDDLISVDGEPFS